MWEYIYYRIHEISSLTDSEYVALVGNYNNIDQNDEEQALRDRGYSEARIKHILKDSTGTSFKSLNVIFHAKNNLKHPFFSYFINLFMSFQKGILPFEGALVDQPAKIIEVFDVLQQLRYESEEAMRKTLEKENKKRGKG